MNFQDICTTLQSFWRERGCIVLQPYDMEVGAGTSHPASGLRCLDADPWNVVYIQPCRRPRDGRWAENPNRMQHYYQLQVLMKPSPENVQKMTIESLTKFGIDSKLHDLRFVEDDWENPTLGAWGLGWEVWCDGMEIIQFTYMQQLAGIECKPVPCEITYGLERIAMYIQNKNSVWDIEWDNNGTSYGDIFARSEKQYCDYNFHYADTTMLKNHFSDYIRAVEHLVEHNAIQPAYDYCLKASHIFNVLEARGVLSVAERVLHMKEVRNAVRKCCNAWCL